MCAFLNYDNYLPYRHMNELELKKKNKKMKMCANMCELWHYCEAEHDIKTAKKRHETILCDATWQNISFMERKT